MSSSNPAVGSASAASNAALLAPSLPLHSSAAPVVPLGPLALSRTAVPALSIPLSLPPAGSFALPLTAAALSGLSAAQLALLFVAVQQSAPMELQRAAAQLAASSHRSAMPRTLALPARLSGKKAGEAREPTPHVVQALAVDQEAPLVISLKEDSERRRLWERGHSTARLSAASSRATDQCTAASTATSSANTASNTTIASAPPTPVSVDADDSPTGSTSTSTYSSSSLPSRSPVLDGIKHEIHSPPAIGLLKDADGPPCLSTVGRLLLSSTEARFGLDDDDMDELGNLSPPAVYTPPRRGSFSGAERKADEHEPLDALAYLHSLTSTPCSSTSSRLWTPLGGSSPSSSTAPPLLMTPSLYAPPITLQPFAVGAGLELLNDDIDRMPLREMQRHFAEQQGPHAHRRPSLYTVAAVNPTASAAEVTALRDIQQRTIAAKLHNSDTQPASAQDSDEQAAIIVKQPAQQPDTASKKPASSKRKKKRKRAAASSSKSAAGSSASNRRRRLRTERKENRAPQQCEQCHRSQADSEYGTGRFCGPRCARTYSITKRYTNTKARSTTADSHATEADDETEQGEPGWDE